LCARAEVAGGRLINHGRSVTKVPVLHLVPFQ
jgi:hypothetical protein